MRTRRQVLWLAAAAGRAAETEAARLDAIFTPLVTGRMPGLAVLVRRNGQTLFQRGYGVTELRTNTPIDEHTNFRLASFSKQFTAMAVLLLHNDGKLRLEDPLTRVFPEFPAYGRAITLRHLLTHTSGLPDYEELMDDRQWSVQKQIHDEDVLRLLEGAKAGKFAPGRGWSYSNSGYVLLGLVVGRASGLSYGEFLHRRIFAPLGMAQTLAYVAGRNSVPHRAYGHAKGPGGFFERDQSSTSATLGDGGIYSNLIDLARWDESLARHTLVNQKVLDEAWTPVKLADGGATRWPVEKNDDNLNPGKPVEYGYGWFLDPYRGERRMWHTGSTTSFRTVIQRFPDRKLTVIVLANRTDLDVAALSLRAVDALR